METELKNYTSEVPVERTVSRIEAVLMKAGADGITKTYREGELFSIGFTIPGATKGSSMTVRMPARVDAVERVLTGEVRRPSKATKERVRRQAARTAWKLMQDWIEVQVSLIELQQVDVVQVFLPYLHDGQQTFYENIKAGSYKALENLGFLEEHPVDASEKGK